MVRLSFVEKQSIRFLSIQRTVVSLQQHTLGPHTHTTRGNGGTRVDRDRCGVRGECASIYYSLFKWTGTQEAGTGEGSHVSYTAS